MVDGTEQALAFAKQGFGKFTPTHVSHKQVEAYPLGHMEKRQDGTLLAYVELQQGGSQISVILPADIVARGWPDRGSMLVRYAPDEAHPDGYVSFSPRAAFDAGYSPIAGARTGNMADAVSVLFATFRAELQKLGDSRELAVALTHLDTARLWAREHAAR